MELLHELLITPVIALLFSFLIAKLVSMAMAAESTRDPLPTNTQNADKEIAGDFDEAVVVDDLRFHEKLQFEERGSETITEFVEEVTETVEKFVGEAGKNDRVIEAASSQSPKESAEKDEEVAVEYNVDVGKRVEVAEGATEEGKRELEIDVEDDDWEGIERTEVEKVFAEAVKFVEFGEKDERFGSDVDMELYGLHKVATEGPCHEQPPMALKVSARAKWNAWQRLGNMTPEKAMEQYIAFVSDRVPDWNGDKCTGERKARLSEAANPHVIAPDLTAFSSNRPNILDERNLGLKDSEKSDLTGCSNMENRAIE